MLRGEIWWASFPQARGGKIRKRRPAVIVSNDISNRYLNRVQVVPMTSKVARVYPSETLVRIGERTSKAMADQLTTLAKEYVHQLIGQVTAAEIAAIERAILYQLGLS